MDKLLLAGCLIFDDQGRFLLIHRNTPKRVQWEIPGGKIDEDERPEEAAIREIKEELGVEAKIIREIGNRDFTEDNYQIGYRWFLVDVIKGTPRIVETDKYDELRYFSWDQAQELIDDLSSNTKNLVEEYSAKRIVF